MYIEDKLFSETTRERYYSVTMTEEEYSLYSEFLEKTFNSKAQKILRARHELSTGIRATVGTQAAPSKLWKAGETWDGALETNRSIGRRVLKGETPMFKGKGLFS